MAGYIQVGRRFAEYDPAASTEADDFSFLYSDDYSAPFTWADLLKRKACVVLAEGQSGKSEEFKQQALALCASGKFAFYCPLESLLSLQLATALEGGASPELGRWLVSNEPAWFFLDAVDEAKISGPRHFDRAIARAMETIGPHLARAHILISSRPHAWDATADHIMVSQRLGLPQPEERSQARSEHDDDATIDESVQIEPGAATEKSEKVPAVLQIFRLAPLTRPQVLEFARAQEVPDIDDFIRAIERANADVFANRPDDLLGLIALWKTTKRIESYTKVVHSNIERKLAERNPQHEHAAKLTPERTMIGAEQLAAAVTLSRKLGLIVPQQTATPQQAEQCIDPRQALPDWQSGEIVELLSRPLFNQSFYGAVRFHHRTAREYLTARWLSRLLNSGKHRRSIYDLLFARPYNVEREVIRPSLQPIAAWLAQWDQDVRARVQKVDSTVLLGWGDAAALPIEVRSALLEGFADRYEGRERTPLDLHIRDIQRLADSGLAPTIRKLFAKHSGNRNLRRLLLKLIEEARIETCKELAESVIYDRTADNYMRSTAISTLVAAGTAQDAEQAVRFFVDGSDPIDRLLIATLVECCFPNTLQVADLVLLLRKAMAPRDSMSSGLRYQLEKAARRIQSVRELLLLLSEVEGLLSQKPHIDRFCPVSQRHTWLLEFGATLVSRLVELKPETRTEPAVISVLRMGVRTDHIQEFTGDVRKIVSSILEQDPALFRHMFWQEVTRAKQEGDPTPIVSWRDRRLTFHRFEESDLSNYLDDIRSRGSISDRQLALSVVISIATNQADPTSTLAMARNAVREVPALQAFLENETKPREPSVEERKHRREMRQFDRRIESQRLDREKKRQEDISWFKANAQSLVIGDHAKHGKLLTNINYLYRELMAQTERRSRWATDNWRGLTNDFGEEVAKAFRDYCVSYWRLYEPTLRSDPSTSPNSTPTAIIIGLCGLEIEANETKDWVQTLTPTEAAQASRYALWELNGFPRWFGDLADAHFEAVRGVLRCEMDWEFQQPDNPHIDYFILSRLRYHQPDLREALHSDVLGLVATKETMCAPALAAALSAILSSKSPLPADFREVILRHSRVEALALRTLWLTALLCIDATTAFPMVKEWVESASDQTAAEERLIPILDHIWGEKESSLNTEHRSFENVEVLLGLLRLAHARTSLGDESLRHRSGIVSDRDRAVRALDAAMSTLANHPGKKAHDALLELADAGLKGLPRDNMLILAERRAENDTELAIWSADDIVSFRNDAERMPRNLEDLFAIAQHRLDDVKLELEEGDESPASTWRLIDEETEFRKLLAGALRKSARGFYGVGSEEELANAQRTDIRLDNPAVVGRMPIEIKIADKWSGNDLATQLREQLLQDYMRESSCGIFLLIRRGRPTDKLSWRHPNTSKLMDFTQLLDWLSQEAEALQRAHEECKLQVIGIDLKRRQS